MHSLCAKDIGNQSIAWWRLDKLWKRQIVVDYESWPPPILQIDVILSDFLTRIYWGGPTKEIAAWWQCSFGVVLVLTRASKNVHIYILPQIMLLPRPFSVQLAKGAQNMRLLIRLSYKQSFSRVAPNLGARRNLFACLPEVTTLGPLHTQGWRPMTIAI